MDNIIIICFFVLSEKVAVEVKKVEEKIIEAEAPQNETKKKKKKKKSNFKACFRITTFFGG